MEVLLIFLTYCTLTHIYSTSSFIGNKSNYYRGFTYNKTDFQHIHVLWQTGFVMFTAITRSGSFLLNYGPLCLLSCCTQSRHWDRYKTHSHGIKCGHTAPMCTNPFPSVTHVNLAQIGSSVTIQSFPQWTQGKRNGSWVTSYWPVLLLSQHTLPAHQSVAESLHWFPGGRKLQPPWLYTQRTDHGLVTCNTWSWTNSNQATIFPIIYRLWSGEGLVKTHCDISM